MNAQVVSTKKSLDEIIVLLRENKLPFQDIQLVNSLYVGYHDEEGRLVGSAGLEFYLPYALIRSVAVRETQRGKSIGTRIVVDMLERAREKGVEEVYLLTETARDFFAARGFSNVARERVPDKVKASSEFSSVCPVSAAVMVYSMI